jgi:hypothetical protein
MDRSLFGEDIPSQEKSKRIVEETAKIAKGPVQFMGLIKKAYQKANQSINNIHPKQNSEGRCCSCPFRTRNLDEHNK